MTGFTRADYAVYKYPNAVDQPPYARNALDDEFEGTSLSSQWTWRNQGSATATVGNGQLLLTGTSQAGIAWRILEQTAPSTPWTITAKLGLGIDNANYGSGGLVLVDSVSGELLRWGLSWDSPFKLQMTEYSSVTAFSAHKEAFNTAVPMLTPVVLRIRDDGTNLYFQYAPTGVNFYTIYSYSRTSHLNNGPDRIGVGCHNESSSTATQLSVDWFRVNWTP